MSSQRDEKATGRICIPCGYVAKGDSFLNDLKRGVPGIEMKLITRKTQYVEVVFDPGYSKEVLRLIRGFLHKRIKEVREIAIRADRLISMGLHVDKLPNAESYRAWFDASARVLFSISQGKVRLPAQPPVSPAAVKLTHDQALRELATTVISDPENRQAVVSMVKLECDPYTRHVVSCCRLAKGVAVSRGYCEEDADIFDAADGLVDNALTPSSLRQCAERRAQAQAPAV